MVIRGEAWYFVLEESRRRRRFEMRELPVVALRTVVWWHPLLPFFSWCSRMDADIAMAVCRWTPAQR
jgi:hypothetical protein